MSQSNVTYAKNSMNLAPERHLLTLWTNPIKHRLEAFPRVEQLKGALLE
jgi:hypothetical protein